MKRNRALISVFGIIALQLFIPASNFDTPWLTFGRLRPLHTNAVIFAFCGNAIFAGIYHSSQRLLKARMFSDVLSAIHFWGWQLIIVLAAITLPLGFNSTKETLSSSGRLISPSLLCGLPLLSTSL